MATWTELVGSSLIQIGVLALGEELEESGRDEGLKRLRLLLDTWAVQGLLVPSLSRIRHTVTERTNTFTLGVSTDDPDIEVNSPYTELRVVSYRSSAERDLYPLNRLNYSELVGRFAESSTYPNGYYYEGGFPLAEIRFDSNLDIDDVFEIAGDTYLVPEAIVGTGAFSLPREYERALLLSLALELAPAYGSSVSGTSLRETKTMAKEAKSGLMQRNIQPVRVKYDLSLILTSSDTWRYHYQRYSLR